MGKKTKKIQYFYRPMPYYPMMYYQGRKTKKKSKNDFKNTYGNNFTPQLMMAKPIKKIRFGKKDKPKKIASNILDLYNIDFNPEFLDFAFNKFHNKINEYRSILNDYNYYVDSVNGIKSSTELLELQTVMNPNELHLLLEAIDVLFESAKSDKEKFMTKVRSNMVNILQRGGSYVRKYDIIAFLNGDKRSRIKNRICDIIYLNEENSENLLVLNYPDGFANKINRIRNDETIDNCFNMFLQQKILEHLEIKDKEKNAYYRGEFQTIIANCEEKEYYDHRMFYKKLKKSGLRKEGKEGKTPQFRSLPEPTPAKLDDFIEKNKGYKKMDDNFEFYSGLSMIDIKKLDKIRLAGKHFGSYSPDDEKLYDELTELIQAFHEVQIPDTDAARTKEKKIKEYISNLNFGIIMGGLLPPSFFGPDNDYNPFDILSVIMCIFEGSTVCALMSALPLFSPLMDGMATFSVFRKIFRKLGIGDNLGIRSKQAISDAFAAKIAKENKLAETINQLRTNIHKANKNLLAAQKAKKFSKAAEIKNDLLKFAKQNKKLAKAKEASDKAALLARTKETQKSYKLFMKNKKAIQKKIEMGEELSNKQKILLKETNEFFATKGVGVETKLIDDLGKNAKGFGKGTELDGLKKQFEKIQEIVDKGDQNIKDLWQAGTRDGFFKVQYKFKSLDDLKLADKLDVNLGKYSDSTTEIYAETAKQYDNIMAGKDLQKQFDSGDFGADFVQNLIKENPEVHKFLDDAFPGKFTQEAVDTAKRTGVNKIRVSNDEADFFAEQLNMQYVKLAGDNYYGPVRMLNKSKSYYESTGILIDTAAEYTQAMKPHLFPDHSVAIKMSDQLADASKVSKAEDALSAADNAVLKVSDDSSKYFDELLESTQKSVDDLSAKSTGLTNEITDLLQGPKETLNMLTAKKKASKALSEAQDSLRKLELGKADPQDLLKAKQAISDAAQEAAEKNQELINFLSKKSKGFENITDATSKSLEEIAQQARTKQALIEANTDIRHFSRWQVEGTKELVFKTVDINI